MKKVIVKFITGEEKKGDILFFNINKSTFPLQVENKEGRTETLVVSIDSVKTIHFLKKEEVSGSHLRKETIEQSMFVSSIAYKLVVEFEDGEVMHGSTHRYNPKDRGFFLVPLNPADISERIYVNKKAVKNVNVKRLIGKIFVDQRKITSQQLEEALASQRKIRKKRIGAILVEEEIINNEQLHESLQKQRERYRLLGEILIEAGYITPEQLQYALRIQKEKREKKLGQILVELKYVTPSDICIALASQLHYPWIDLSTVKIPLDIATSLPEEVVRRLGVIPVEKKEGNVLVVATSQPQDPDIRLEASKFTALKVELVIAYEGHIEEAINYCFSTKK